MMAIEESQPQSYGHKFSHRRPLLGRWGLSALRLYTKTTLGIMLLLLIIALSIDLADHFPAVRRTATKTNTPLLATLLPYMLYRAADIVTRLLPMACFIGIFLAEILRWRRLEAVLLATSGLSPLRALAPVLVFGLLFGSVQMGLENFLRPAAVFRQVTLGIGDYAGRFERGLTGGRKWIVSQNDALIAQVFKTDAPALIDVELFRGINQKTLTSILTAKRAIPMDQPGVWQFQNGLLWDFSAGQSGGQSGGQSTIRPTAFEKLDITLDLIPEHLTYFNIPGFYIPAPNLAPLARRPDTPAYDAARVAVWRRYTALLLPMVYALLGASLAQAGYSGRLVNIPRLLTLAFIGYISIVSVKTLWELGELGVVSPAISTLAPLLVATLIGLGIQIWRS